ncbi:MAG TPA: radical SAM protein [Candidatus Goldiibacteriota bacterium]|nr:radical SAM protein [Candidatus Goldiibacteriota bacterium]
MKIIFVIPAADIRRTLLYRMGNNFYGRKNPIVGPLILAGILKKAGHTVEVYEELYEDVDYSKISDCDVLGIYTMTSNVRRAYEMADYFRKEKEKRVVIGGMHASVMPEEASQHADQVVVGEAENVIVDVMEGRSKEKIVYARPVKDLDTIPFPDYSLLKTPCNEANVLTTRGCLFKCNFCSTSRMFDPFRARSPENVIEELKTYKKMGFKYMNFQDDNFTADKDRAKAILRKMIENNLAFRDTFFFGRTDIANDPELLQLLRNANLRCVLVGIESLNQESLNYINKKQVVDDIKRAGEMLYKYKIKLLASLVLGLDYDGKEEIRKSVEFCKSINAYQLQPAILTPYPKTPIYKQFEEENRIIVKDWQYYDMMTVVFKPKKLTPWELQKEFFNAVKKFYSFPSIFKIFRIFGFKAGLNRIGLWFVTKFGILYNEIKANINDGNVYNFLKNYKAS